ncbi:outer membrane beta-barrel protein [Moritella sp. 36]|uniref:outer membrane beta-barrel protein n=1 Tax=Moritella sp. 36 TaxID=2746233 RepID=UPI001BA8E745|nr:outer membrane beta-barrel protein [Moritella sp. 36]QUM89232.1 outer membrane beta-barrel protein [Moritella sp. 36]
MKAFKDNYYCLGLGLGLGLVLLSGGAVAYTQDTYITDGGLFVKPSLEVSIVEDDNIYKQQNNGTSSSIITVIPMINLKLDDGINYFSLDAKAEKGIYEASSADNYMDGLLGFNVHLEPSDTHRLDINLKAEWLAEPRGSGLTELNYELTNEPITYGKKTLSAKYEYGALQTKGRLAFNAKFYEKEYSNFETITRRSNHDSLLLGSIFFYSTRAHTDVFIEINAETIGYDYNKPGDLNRDSDVYTALLGMQWKASSVVHGFIKLGGQAKEFDDKGRKDFTGFSWNIGGVWRPLTYSKITLSTSQTTKDPDVDGDYVLETKYKLDWKHNWTSYFYSSVGVYKFTDDYSGISRVDDTDGYKIKFNYDFTDNIAITLFGLWDRNTSTNTIFEYDKNVVGASLTLTL